jgi:hypothetical protein
LLSQRGRRSRQKEGRNGGREGGRKGGGERGEDVAFVQIVVEPVRSEEEEVTRLGAEGEELSEFRTVAEGGREGGREGKMRMRAKTSM